MTCGLVDANYSLPEWQAVKLTFFAPCLWHSDVLFLEICVSQSLIKVVTKWPREGRAGEK